MSSDRYAVISFSATIYLFTKSGRTDIITGAATIEAAVNVLAKVAPPKTIKGVYIMSDTDFQTCRRSVAAVQNAGYTDIELVETFRFGISSMLYNLPLNSTNGDIVFVLAEALGQIPVDQVSVAVLRKCENGWQFICADKQPLKALTDFPSVTCIVYHKDTPEAVMKKVFPGRKLHVSGMEHPFFIDTFFQNRINKGNFNGYEVLPFCIYNLVVEFGNTFDSIYLTTGIPPFTITKEIDVGDAPTVQIRACESDITKMPLIKTFNFKSTKFRTVAITVTIDKALMPHVTLKTVVARDSDAMVVLPETVPQKVADQNPVTGGSKYSLIYSIIHGGSFTVARLYQNEESGQESFPTIDDVIAFMKDRTSNTAATAVLFHYSEISTIDLMQGFRQKCRNAGFFKVRFIPYESLPLSLLFGTVEYHVDDGKSVAIVYPEKYYVVVRDGRHLKIRTWGSFNIEQINSHNVDSVIITNVLRNFTKEELDGMLPKLKSKNVRIAAGMKLYESIFPPFLRSSADETASNDYAFNNFCDFDVVINGQRSILTRFVEIPFSVTAEVAVFDKTVLEVQLLRIVKLLEPLKTFPIACGTKSVRIVVRVESACDITVTMEAVGRVENTDKPKAVSDSKESTVTSAKKPSQPKMATTVSAKRPDDRTLDVPLPLATSNDAVKVKKNRSQRRKQARLNAAKNGTGDEPAKATDVPSTCHKVLTNRPFMTILTFTSDNRVLIEADTSYTGNKEVLAYVRLQIGKVPEVGKHAFDALKKDRKSVFYGLTRLLAADFDPDHPDPSWRFKTARDADGQVVIRGRNGVVTFPIVLFGLVVRSTLLYIQEHVESEITSLGIRLPSGCAIPDAELKDVSKRIGVELVLL
uniref:Early transcription factor 82 kDa subunit n=1 Tax=Panagrellus redivivus TaxID=6233 RepID=A0A7E4ZUT4_PANRE